VGGVHELEEVGRGKAGGSFNDNGHKDVFWDWCGIRAIKSHMVLPPTCKICTAWEDIYMG
jgi:hypothetical protein